MPEDSHEPTLEDWQPTPFVVVAVRAVQEVLADPAMNEQVLRLSRQRLDACDDVRASDEARFQAERLGDHEARTGITDHLEKLAEALRAIGEPATEPVTEPTPTPRDE